MQAAFLHALIKAGTAILMTFIWHSSSLSNLYSGVGSKPRL